MKIRFLICLFVVTLFASSIQAAIWEPPPPGSSGWTYVEGLGWLYPIGDSGWAYHASLDWIYSPSTDLGSIWIYRPMCWFWTNSVSFPYLWQEAGARWVYFNCLLRPIGDIQAGGVFQIPDSFNWFWERCFSVSLPLYGSEFDKEIAQVEELPNGEPGSGTATFLYDVQDVIDYFIAHPKANSEPYAVMEKLESMPSGQRLYFNEFLAEERVELHMAMGFLKRQYQLRVFYNEMELARLQFRIEEAVYGPLAGSGYVNVCIGGVWMTYHMLWIS